MYFRVIVLIFLFTSATCLDLESFYQYVQYNNSNSNSQCEEQKFKFLQGLMNGDDWALKMLDAYGRFPEGISQGSKTDLGMFDQCLNIRQNFDDDVDIKGKYCYGGLVIPLLDISLNVSEVDEAIKSQVIRAVQPTSTENITISLRNVLLLAACIPDACSASDLFGELGVDIACQTKDENQKLESEDIACLVFFFIITWLLVLSTGYDVYLNRKSKEPKHAVLLAFSIYTNGKKIIKTSQQSDQILFINGMKVLSMFWVIMGHRYATLEAFVLNKEEAKAWRRNWYAVYVLLAPMAVDTFLFVSGVLLSYIFLKTMRKPNQKFNIVMYYLHRYLRLTPALAVLYFFQITLARRVQTGPLSPLLTEYNSELCTNGNWWSFFLYVQNYVNTDKMCMIHTWYLSIDMQFYIISPLLLLPMHYYGKRVTYIVLPILTLVTITYTMLIFYFYDISLWSSDYYNKFYYLTHTRFAPWLIGLIFGAFLLDYQANPGKYQIRNKLIVLAMWGAMFCLMAFVFFYQDDADYNHTRIKSTFFFPLQRPLWTLCLVWISYACLSGNGGFINTFLSISFFQIFSKITYSTYLIHLLILMLNLGHMRTMPYFTDIDSIRIVIADIFVSYLVGALWTLAFESPIIVFEKIVFGGGGRRKGAVLNQPKNDSNGEDSSSNTSVKVNANAQLTSL